MGEPQRALYQRFPMLGETRAQVWSYAPEYRRPRHFHAEPELNLVVAGRARFGIGDLDVEVGPGEILGFAPGQDHVMLEATQDLVLFAVGMDPALSTEVLVGDALRVALPIRLRPSTAEWNAIVRNAAIASERHDQGFIAELWERIYERRWATSEAGGMHVLTRRTLESLSAEPHLSRECLAHLARGNPSEISRSFHRDMGMKLVDYRTRLRLLRFIRLVDERTGNLTSAALEAGFGSYSQCHRSFQAEFTCAPREYFATGLRERMDAVFEPLVA